MHNFLKNGFDQKNQCRLFVLVVVAFSQFHCAKEKKESREPLTDISMSMRPVAPESRPQIISDDLPLLPLLQGIRANLFELQKRESMKEVVFGNRVVEKEKFLLAMTELVEKFERRVEALDGWEEVEEQNELRSSKNQPASEVPTPAPELKKETLNSSEIQVDEQAPTREQIRQQLREDFLNEIRANFDFYEVYGREKWGEVKITSYYDPVIQGSKVKTEEFSQAVYAVPEDLVTVRLDEFMETFPRLRKSINGATEQKTSGYVIRGRIKRRETGPPHIVPFYSRKEIDEDLPLKGQGLELAWVTPVDAFFLHIQGSGVIEFSPEERIRVGYAGQNGHRYVAIGKHLLHKIPLEKMSMQAIREHLETLSHKEKQDILNLNPSYVFFTPLESKSITYFGTEVIAGRTIATDYRFFPKGALAYLELEVPVFKEEAVIHGEPRHLEENNKESAKEPFASEKRPSSSETQVNSEGESENDHPVAWRKTSRLVIDQDTGGAIRGGHRLDLYWGQGDEAAKNAGVMKNWGRLFYLVPKESYIEKLLVEQKQPSMKRR